MKPYLRPLGSPPPTPTFRALKRVMTSLYLSKPTPWKAPRQQSEHIKMPHSSLPRTNSFLCCNHGTTPATRSQAKWVLRATIDRTRKAITILIRCRFQISERAKNPCSKVNCKSSRTTLISRIGEPLQVKISHLTSLKEETSATNANMQNKSPRALATNCRSLRSWGLLLQMVAFGKVSKK